LEARDAPSKPHRGRGNRKGDKGKRCEGKD